MITASEATNMTREALRKVNVNIDNALTIIENNIVKTTQKGEYEAKGQFSGDIRSFELIFIEHYLHNKGFGAIVDCSPEHHLVTFKVSWGDK